MFYAVIRADSSGTCLCPLLRAEHPKFLHALAGTSASLLQATVDRLAPLAAPRQTYVVTGVGDAVSVARQLPALPTENVLVEPSPRDSCAAIGLAAAVIAARDPRAVMGSFAADDLVRDADGFAATVRAAVTGAEQGLLVTVGVRPTYPETGYGYLRCGAPVGDGPMRRVDEFTEKPPYDLAVSYVDDGGYRWNAGMLLWRVDVFLAELARQQPALHAGLTRIAAAWDSPRREEVLGEVWPALPKLPVDRGVLEGAVAAGRVATVPGDFGWNEVGEFHTFGSVLEADAHGNVVLDPAGTGSPHRGEVLLQDSERTVVVPHSGRLVTAVGVHDVIVVDTPDAVLVCPRRAQDVKRLVDELTERGKS